MSEFVLCKFVSNRRHFLTNLMGFSLLISSVLSVASPFSGVFSNQPYQIENDAIPTNPWQQTVPATNHATIQNYQQQHNIQMYQNQRPAMVTQQPSLSFDTNDGRFISQQELDSLNNQSYTSYGSRYSQDWNPLPDMVSNMHDSDFGGSAYNLSYSNNRYGDSNYGYQWGNNYAVMPTDPMSPSRFGNPFSGPFGGLDSFMYE